MEKSLCIGIAIGMVAGALLAVNSCKVRKMICDGQKQVAKTVEKISEKDEKEQNQCEE
jgi:hypothetical protein